MKVIVAKTAGFCMGVRRALALTLDASAQGASKLSTFGPLIHNTQVVEMLERRGVRVIEDPAKAEGRVVLRAHGVTVDEMASLAKAGVEVIDATCPNVRRSERFVEEKAKEGRPVIIAGDAGHAEVKALASRAGREVYVVSSADEAKRINAGSAPVLVAQTTFNEERYDEIARLLKEKYPDITVLDSICRATGERQAEVRELARKADAVVVVGGKHSANTRRLAEIARESGRPTFHVETVDELPADELRKFGIVGVTAGASTPGWVTDAVVEKLTRIGKGAGFGWMRLLIVDSGIALSLLSVLVAVFNQFIAGDFWETGIAYVFFFMLAAYNLNRYSTGRKPYQQVSGGPRRYWVWATVLALTGAAIGGVLWLPSTRIGARVIMLAGIAAPFLFTAPSVKIGARRVRMEDIPYLKDVIVGLAWVVAVSLLQWYPPERLLTLRALFAGLATFLIGIMQSLWAERGNIETDRLFSSGTLAITLGRRGVTIILALGIAAALAMAALALHLRPPLA